MDSWDQVRRRLRALPRPARVEVWNIVDQRPRDGEDFHVWLLAELDAALTTIETAPKPARYGRVWPEACPGTGRPAARVIEQPAQVTRRNGRLDTLPGTGICPACGRPSAFSARSGIRRHVPSPLSDRMRA